MRMRKEFIHIAQKHGSSQLIIESACLIESPSFVAQEDLATSPALPQLPWTLLHQA